MTIDPDILGGTPVFKGTRVPVETLFEYLKNNYSLEEFLECFPSVTIEAACCASGSLAGCCVGSPVNILLDECVPWPIHRLLVGHRCTTPQRRGWGGTTNGDLIRLAEAGFDLFITSDQNIRYQQNLARRRVAILELSTNDLRRLQSSAVVLCTAVYEIKAGEFRPLQIPWG